MKQRIISIVLTLCLCIASPLPAFANPESDSLPDTVLSEESISAVSAQDDDYADLTPTKVYEAMIALKDDDNYKEGTTWTDYVPYYGSGSTAYSWNGGTLDGKNIIAVGCVAFAFILSDAAFDNLPARMYATGNFTFDDIKPGDILRLNTDTHTVIVLEISDAGVIVAEGNYSGTVHWGRAISKEDVMFNTSHYITRYPEGYISPTDPTANESIGNGTLEGGLSWNLTKAGTLTISGKGAMPDYDSASEQSWNAKADQIRKVVIENGVTSIGKSAFWGCGVLSVYIPSSVTKIGNYAFYKSQIISVTIPSGVKTIGDSAFRDCQSLSSVTFSEGLETIEQNAFRACTGLISLDLPASIKTVGDAAFCECTAMIRASFAPGMNQVTLGDNLFTRCYYLMYVTLPKSIDCIGKEMFLNCRMLTGVEIPQGAESIGGSAFASSGLTAVIIPDSVTTIGIAAFSACPLSDIYFTGTEDQWKNISKIGDTANTLSKVALHYNYIPAAKPDDDNTSGNSNNNNSNNNNSNNNSGSNNNNNNNNSDDNNSSNNNNSNSGNNDGSSSNNSGNSGNNNSGNSGNNSGNSGNNNNNGNSSLQKKTPLAKGKTFTVKKITYKVTKTGKEVALIKSKSTAKKVTVNTVTGTDGVKYKITSISSKAMQNNKKMTSLVIGSNVKKIWASAFSGCTKLTTVSFGKNVTSIGANAFKGCKKLRKATVKSTKLTTVGKQAFKGTKATLKIKVPSGKLTKYRRLLKKAGLKSKQITK